MTVREACQVLRKRVRFRDARLRLPDNRYTQRAHEADTAAIIAATTRYVETWIVPILDAIESGDTYALRVLTLHDRGEPMDGDK
jgi:hypothetical protein